MFVKELNQIKFDKLHSQKVTNEIKIIRAQSNTISVSLLQNLNVNVFVYILNMCCVYELCIYKYKHMHI